MTAIEKARQRARKAIESMYEGRCTIEGYEKYTDPNTHITKTRKVTIFENEPCKLSFEKLDAANRERVRSP
jgi:hypothetical protein